MFITENLETRVYGEYDVIVVGAGPAGCAAAISAARNGMKTLIIDRFNCLGGTKCAWDSVKMPLTRIFLGKLIKYCITSIGFGPRSK